MGSGVCLWLEIVFFLMVAIYWPNLNLSGSSALCTCGVHVFEKWLESLWFISLLDSHFPFVLMQI